MLSYWFPLGLENQHFKYTLLGGGEGVMEKSTLCTLVKMLKMLNHPLIVKFCFHNTTTNDYAIIQSPLLPSI